MTRSRRLLWFALGASGSAFVFLVAYRFVLHHFMAGPFLWDQGWYASAIFQNGFLLPNPPYLRPNLGESLFTQHLYGLVSLASPLSHLFSTHYFYFATVVGVSHALTFVGPFLLVLAAREPARRTWLHALIATVAGLAFALSGAAVSELGYPHFEIAIPALFLVFLALYLLGFRRTSWIALALGLLVREDAGLHYFGYLAVIAIYQRRTIRQPITARALAGAAVASLTVSVIMLVVQRQFFPLGQSMFVKSFIGSPAFAHVSWAASSTRLRAFVAGASGPALYAPVLLIAAAAVLVRSASYVLAFVACLPWIIANVFFSLTPAAQTLSLYYSFPLLVGLAWPLLAVHWGSDRAARYGSLVCIGACVLSALVLPFHANVMAAAKVGGALSAEAYSRQRACLEAEFRSTDDLYADTAVVAMFPQSVPPKRVLRTEDDVARSAAHGLIFFEDAKASAYYDRAQASGLHRSVVLTAPPLRLLSREPSGFGSCVENK